MRNDHLRRNYRVKMQKRVVNVARKVVIIGLRIHGPKSVRTRQRFFSKKPDIIAFVIVQDGRTSSEANYLLAFVRRRSYEYSMRSFNVSLSCSVERYVYFGTSYAIHSEKIPCSRVVC